MWNQATAIVVLELGMACDVMECSPYSHVALVGFRPVYDSLCGPVRLIYTPGSAHP